MMKLDSLKHGDIAVLHVNGHSLLFLAGELYGMKNGDGVLLLSDKIATLEFPEWHEFAVAEAFPDQRVIRSIKHDELSIILHVKSLRTIRHELHGTQIGNDKTE